MPSFKIIWKEMFECNGLTFPPFDLAIKYVKVDPGSPFIKLCRAVCRACMLRFKIIGIGRRF